MIPENGKTYWAQELPEGAVQIVYVADGAAWTIGNSTRHPIPAFEYLSEVMPYISGDVLATGSFSDMNPPVEPAEPVLPEGAGPAVIVDSGGVGGGVNPDAVL